MGKQKLTYEQTVKRLHSHYQRQFKNLAKLEKRMLDTCTTADEKKVIELRGYLRGIKKTLNFVDQRMGRSGT